MPLKNLIENLLMLALATSCDSGWTPTAGPLDPEDAAFLNRLRIVALQCRAAARLDLFRACDLLHATADTSATAYAEALVRTLSEGLNKPARFHAPGETELTFDERWLMSVLQAVRCMDRDSVVFLIHRRIRLPARHAFRLILAGLAREMDAFAQQSRDVKK